MSKERHWFKAGLQLSVQLVKNTGLLHAATQATATIQEFKFQFCPMALLEQHKAQWTSGQVRF